MLFMKFMIPGTLGTQAFCSPLINSKPYILPDHSRNVQVIVNPNKKSRTFDSAVISVVHNVSTIHEIKVGK